MTGEEFHRLYKLLEQVTDGDVRSFHALASTGAVVMVHFVDGAGEVRNATLARLGALESPDRERILSVLEVDGQTVVVTKFLLEFRSLPHWLEARVPEPPAPATDHAAAAPEMPREPEAPEDPTGPAELADPTDPTEPAEPGEFTRIFLAQQGAGSPSADPPDPPAAQRSEPKRPELPRPEPAHEVPEDDRTGTPTTSGGTGDDTPGEFTLLFRSPIGEAEPPSADDPPAGGSSSNDPLPGWWGGLNASADSTPKRPADGLPEPPSPQAEAEPNVDGPERPGPESRRPQGAGMGTAGTSGPGNEGPRPESAEGGTPESGGSAAEPGEFTRIFGRPQRPSAPLGGVPPTAGPPPSFPSTSGPPRDAPSEPGRSGHAWRPGGDADDAYLDRLGTRRPETPPTPSQPARPEEPAPADPRESFAPLFGAPVPPPAAPKAGPSEYTRIISGARLEADDPAQAASPAAAPPPERQPQPGPPQAEATARPPSILPIVIGLVLVVVTAAALVLYFALAR